MKRIKFFSFLICLFLMTTQIIAQGPQIQTRTWKDGNPSFQNTSLANNVRIDSIVSLIATSGFIEEPEIFQLILNVIDSSWSWPGEINLVSVADIEYYIDNNDSIHYVVTDVDGRKIIDVILSSPEAKWTFEGQQVNSPRYLKNPVDTYVYKENNQPIFLITDQGRHRVIKVDRVNNIIKWQYGDESEGSGFNQLYYPSDAVALPASGQVLICDKGNNRVILVNEADTTIAWEWGQGELNRPVDIEYDFNTKEALITDQGNNRVIKVDSQTDSITWQYDIGLNTPIDADFLPNGNILICDKDNNRLIEVDYSKQIVWQLESELENLNDADRLSDNKHLIITNGQPYRIGYITKEFISEPKDLGVAVSFGTLFWFANTIPGLTSIQMQLRSENTLADLVSAPWRGPTEGVPVYTISGFPINPAHNGHRFYQFKATLQTSDPLFTPALNNVKVTYNYYNTNTTGNVTSNVISDSADFIITKWKSLKFNTILPPNPINRDKVEIKISILDTDDDTLRSFIASKADPTNEVALDNIESLKSKQSIKLQAQLRTISTAATPVLKNWEVNWEATPLTNAQINFVKLVNQEFKSTSYYRVPEFGQEYIDYVNVKLIDPNLLPIKESVDLNITSILSQDSEPIKLGRKTQGWYILETSLPAIIADTVISNDGILQVHDRDYLVVSYTDPITPTDQASDTALIVQNTAGTIQFLVQEQEGEIQIQEKYYTQIDTASIGDTIYVHIYGEKDRDLTQQQDKFSITIFDDFETRDEETLSVVEVPDDSGEYTTGEFISTGLRLVASRTAIFYDSLMQTYGGSRISVRYDETISKIPILQVVGDQLPIPTEAYTGTGSLDFDLAPNPYYSNRHNLLRIRVASAIGDITVEKIEIYNFAGQKIKNIDGSQLNFYYNYPIAVQHYSYADGWWNLKDQNGISVSSGTYWVKVVGKVVDSDEHLSHIKKLLIIR